MNWINYFLAPDQVMVITELFIFTSLLIGSIQHIANINEFGPAGLLSWDISKQIYTGFIKNKTTNALFSKTGFLWLNIVRILIIFYCYYTYNHLQLWTVVLLLVCNLIIYFRTIILINGADQMNSIALIFVVLYAIFAPHAFHVVIIFFLTAHLIICYFTSGFLKILESSWTNGKALKGISLTKTYSIPQLSKFIKNKHNNYLRQVSLFAIFWELLFLFTPFMNLYFLILFLGLGVLFHLLNAIILGLNTFLFTFLALYPCVIFTNLYIHRLYQ